MLNRFCKNSHLDSKEEEKIVHFSNVFISFAFEIENLNKLKGLLVYYVEENFINFWKVRTLQVDFSR